MKVIFKGNVIQKERKARGLTQRQLATKSGIAQANICRWEKSINTPSATQLALISKILEFDIMQAFIFKK